MAWLVATLGVLGEVFSLYSVAYQMRARGEYNYSVRLVIAVANFTAPSLAVVFALSGRRKPGRGFDVKP